MPMFKIRPFGQPDWKEVEADSAGAAVQAHHDIDVKAPWSYTRYDVYFARYEVWSVASIAQVSTAVVA